MDFDEFTIYYPELYSMMVEDVRYAIETYPITGSEPLMDWDNLVDNLVNKYQQQNTYGDNTEAYRAQQYPGSYRDRDWDWDDRYRRRRRRRRRRFRDFDLRDIIRIIFLRRLFDRNRYY